ncbi:DUF1254 domain-containing protein [bacterium]|nr:DUF1254 domain-containing protein [bacterium]
MAAEPQGYWDALSSLPFQHDFPTADTETQLYEALIFQRATQIFLLSLPALHMLSMRDALQGAFGQGFEILPLWPQGTGASTKLGQAQAGSIQGMGFLDLKREGPLVLQVPPRVQGTLTDFWQRPLSDFGPSSANEGKGGLYLVLPPAYQGHIPQGYRVLRAATYGVGLFLHAGAELMPVQALNGIRIFPLLGRDQARRPMRFPAATETPLDLRTPRDFSIFEKLARFIEDEPVEMVDGLLRGMMASIGIKRGKPFQPDERRQRLLTRAAELAPKMILAMRTRGCFTDERYFPDRQWLDLHSSVDALFQALDHTAIDARSYFYLTAALSAPMLATPTLGRGSKCPFAMHDADGALLSGDQSYRLHLPPEVPAADGWAVSVHHVADGTMLDHGDAPAIIRSREGREQNQDGSFDVFFGPRPPEAGASNWLRTQPGRGFVVVLHLYGPEQAFFDQCWKPGDLERLPAHQAIDEE